MVVNSVFFQQLFVYTTQKTREINFDEIKFTKFSEAFGCSRVFFFLISRAAVCLHNNNNNNNFNNKSQLFVQLFFHSEKKTREIEFHEIFSDP